MLLLQLWNLVEGLIYYCTCRRENFSLIIYSQMKFCLFKVTKSDVCIRLPFTNQSHIITYWKLAGPHSDTLLHTCISSELHVHFMATRQMLHHRGSNEYSVSNLCCFIVHGMVECTSLIWINRNLYCSFFVTWLIVTALYGTTVIFAVHSSWHGWPCQPNMERQ